MYEIDTSLRAVIGAIAAGAALDDALRVIAESVVASLGAGACKIWLVKNGDLCESCALRDSCIDRSMCLHLRASAPGIGVELPRVPLVVFRDRAAARGGESRVGEGLAGRLLFGVDEAALADGESMRLVPLKGPAGVLGLLGTLRATRFGDREVDELESLADAAVLAIRLADLTSRHQRATLAAEASTRESALAREISSAVLEAATELSVIVEDLDGRVTLFGEGARRTFGYENDEVTGMAASDALFAPEEVLSGHVARIFDTAMRDGAVEASVVRLRKNGERFTSKAHFFLRRNEQGDPVGMIVVEREAEPEAATARASVEPTAPRERELEAELAAREREHEKARAEQARALDAARLERDHEIAVRDAKLAEREALLDKRIAEIAALDRQLAETTALLAERDARIDELRAAAEALSTTAGSAFDAPIFVMDAAEALVYSSDASTIASVGRALEATGRRASTFADPNAALDYARAARPGVAVVDLDAPRADAFVAALGSALFAPRFVAIGDASARGAALGRGASRFVARPIAEHAVQRAVEAIDESQRRVLVVVDDRAEQERIERFLEHRAIDLRIVPSWSAARGRLDVERFSAVVVDLCMPGASGFAMLDGSKLDAPPPLLFVADRETDLFEARARSGVAAVLPRAGLTREALLGAVDAAIDARR